MKIKNSHKALLLTFLILGTLLLFVFNLQFAKLNSEYVETIISIETIEENVVETESSSSSVSSKSTNKAYNKTGKHKPFSGAYKLIAPPKDYKRKKSTTKTEAPSKKEDETRNKSKSDIQKNELISFDNVNTILNKHSIRKENSASEASVNKNSSIYYYLKGRTDVYLPVPVYLCNAGGKVVVNIRVNANGQVIKASIRNELSSNNKCLQDHALEYAKEAQFNDAETVSQDGSITFKFKNKN